MSKIDPKAKNLWKKLDYAKIYKNVRMCSEVKVPPQNLSSKLPHTGVLLFLGDQEINGE